jgi:putative hydrolase of the HAD superfamily
MAALTHKKHLFFDLDDTLWDFNRNSGVVLEQLFAEFSLAEKLNAGFPEFHSEYKKTNLQFWSRYYKKEIDKSFLRNNRFKETFKKFNYENHEDNLSITEQYMQRAPHGTLLKDGCIETLIYLNKKYQLHIITNGFKEIQGIKLAGSGIKNYFSNVIISEEHGLTKPDEQIFRLAESISGAKKEDCVMIGDSYESDVMGAVNAGWEAIYISEENPENYSGRTIVGLKELQKLF